VNFADIQETFEYFLKKGRKKERKKEKERKRKKDIIYIF
jgi:hypothetical protein